jgi:hypothetical protein
MSMRARSRDLKVVAPLPPMKDTALVQALLRQVKDLNAENQRLRTANKRLRRLLGMANK